MKLFYIPDGHRRFAAKNSISILDSYHIGYSVLITAVIEPLIRCYHINSLGIFLLSTLNLARRRPDELAVLLQAIDEYVPRLQRECAEFCTVRIAGRRHDLAQRSGTNGGGPPFLDLYVESDTEDETISGACDVLFRSGGGLRLSGAPRKLIGPYTEFYSLDKLHPEILSSDIDKIMWRYRHRYMREQ